MIIIDSREKKFEHITEYFEKNNIEYSIKKLDTGDYSNTESPHILIDRKANLQEVCSNLSKGKENHTRFVKECKRAFDDKVRFIVLIEDSKILNMKEASNWSSKYSKHNGKWLVNEMWLLTMAYRVEWQFCTPNETPKRILELLRYDK